MVYNLKRSDGTPLLTLADSTLDNTSTSLILVGKNSLNFGSSINQDLIYLMQHFANTASPINPLQGQLWYDTIAGTLKVFNGYTWRAIMPPADGSAGIATVVVGSDIIDVLISDGVIVSAVSHAYLARAQLPNNEVINDINYEFGSRFPNGIYPGITLATDPNTAYKFTGTVFQADQLTNPFTLSLGGDATGSVSMNGSQAVKLNVRLHDIVTPASYNKVTVASNGVVISGQVGIDNFDIEQSLGFFPISNVRIVGDITGNATIVSNVAVVSTSLPNLQVAGTYTGVTVDNRGLVTGAAPAVVAPGTYNSVTVSSQGIVIGGSSVDVTAGLISYLVPAGAIIMWSGTVSNIPTGWHLCDGTNGTPDLRSKFIIGAGSGLGSSFAPGSTGGSSTLTLGVANLPAHHHSWGVTSNFSPSDPATGVTYSPQNLWSDNAGDHYPITLFSQGNAVTGDTGSGNPVDIMPPYYALAFIMKS